MNIVQQIIKAQEWIPDVTGNVIASTALKMLANKVISKKYLSELKLNAQKYDVTYLDMLAYNLSYELPMLALMYDKVPTMMEAVKILGRASKDATPCGCTTVGVHKDGKTVMWRNLDWDDPGGLFTNNSILRDTPTAVDATFPGAVGMLTACRKGEYSVAINAVLTEGGSDAIVGTPPTLLLREVIDTCATYDIAVELLCKRELLCPVMFTIVAADGRMQVIERTTSSYGVRGPEKLEAGGVGIIATNNTRVLKNEGNLGELSETSDKRYEQVMDGINSPTALENVMLDAQFGCTIHTVEVDFAAETLVSLYYEQ